jgi:hypothetical protein
LDQCLLGLAVAASWTIYGLRLDDAFMIVPNSIAVLLGLLQTALFVFYGL